MWSFEEEIIAVGCKEDPTISLSHVILSKRASRSLWSSFVNIPENRSPEVPLEISIGSWPEVACRKGEMEKKLVPDALECKGKVCRFHETCTKV
jgi:hypothetical protein